MINEYFLLYYVKIEYNQDIMAKGLHILSDMYWVDFSSLVLSEDNFREVLSYLIELSGLKELGWYSYTFNKISEFTIVIALAESHISIHTWPEKKYVSLDVFVCWIVTDNSDKAKMLYSEIKKIIKPESEKVQFIERWL